MQPGRVVILNGTSSSGKTTLARRFREWRAEAGECWLVVAIDDFNVLLPHQWMRAGDHDGPFSDDGVHLAPEGDGPPVLVGGTGRRLFAAYRRTAAAWAHCGFDVLVDEVCFDEEAAADWRQALSGLPVLWVSVRCDPAVAEARELARGDRLVGLARKLSPVVHSVAPSDAELDTSAADVDDLAARLHALVAAWRP